MRYLTVILTLLLFALNAQAQNEFIRGPEFLCGPLDSVYFALEGINPDEPIVELSWKITPGIPNAEIGVFFENEVYINFRFPGQYSLTATFFEGMSQEPRTVVHDIFVEGFFFEPIVDGCGERLDSVDCYLVCEGSETTVSLESYNGTTTFWNVTGAESFNDFGSYVSIIWGSSGTGTVEYFTECNGQGSLCFDILPIPTADFNLVPSPGNQDTVTVCKGQELYFENTSENGITYTWYFGDGNESESYDADHAYEETGFFTTTLIAGGACDCSSEKSIVFEVLDEPAPTLDCVNSVCPETRQKYTATTDGCNVFNWSISGDGTIVNGGEASDDFIEVIWHSGPDGFITLSVSSCTIAYCSFSNTYRVPIITPDGPVQGDQSVCSGEVATYTAPYFPGTVYNWQVSNQGTIMGNPGFNAVTVRWNNVNSVITGELVSVNYDNCFLDCSGTDNISVQITPVLSLSGDNQICMGDEATCSAFSGFGTLNPANVSWEIRDEEENVLFASAGLLSTFNHSFNYPAGNYYWVGLNNSSDFCNDEIKLRISVTEKPASPIGIEGELEICPGITYGYTIDNAGEYETNWTITDGVNVTTQQGQVINHIFGNNPPYSIEASHVDVQYPDCDSDPISITIINAADKVIAGNQEACHQSIEQYTVDFIGGASYDWEIIPADHGDLQTRSSNEIAVYWSQAGPATIRLSVCGATIDLAVDVKALPSFSIIGPDEACGDDLTTFTTDQPTLSHEWKDENGIVIGNNPSIDLSPGDYSVTLTDVFGCSQSEAFNLRVIPSPSVLITSPKPYYSCAEDAIPLYANTDGDDYTFEWFRDGTLIGTGPSIVGPGFGIYEVEATNQYGCMDRSSGFNYGECCPISDCERGDTECPPSCNLLTNDFDIEISDITCSDKRYRNVSGVEAGSESWFIKRLDETIAIYSGSEVNHAYDFPGYYRIISRARLSGFPYPDAGCFHYKITVDSVLLVADFDVNKSCVGEQVEFEDLTTFIPGQNIVGWSWDFGDPSSGANNTSSDQNPRHTFATAGTYDVTLIAEAMSGCVSRKTQQIYVSGGPELITIFHLINCEEEATEFELTENVFNVMWDFDDPSSGLENSAEVANVMHTYNTASNYSVTVTAEDVYQCSNTRQLPVEIKANTLSGNIDVQLANQICQGETVTLTAPSGGVRWDWSNDESAESITVNTSDEYSVFITDQFNCKYTAPAEFIEVSPKPVVTIKGREILGSGEYGPWVDQLELCDDIAFELHAISTQSLSYLWDNNSTNPILIFAGDGGGFPGPGTHVFSVTGTDPGSNCPSDEQNFTVIIHGLPNVPSIALSSGSACSFDNNVLQVTNVESGMTYIWSDGQEGDQIIANEAGNYSVTAVNSFGCERTSGIINIKRSVPIDQVPAGCHIECDPLTVCLPPLANVASYTIYFNNTVLMTGTAWPSEYIADQDGSYYIEVTSTNGCTVTSDPLDVLLYTGTGTVEVSTYVDVDLDGVISAADTLVGGIYVDIISADRMHEGHTFTEADGQFDFVDYPNSTYLTSIDLDQLSPIWKVVIDSVDADINNCGDIVSASLLLRKNCQVLGPDLFFDLCPGDMIMVGDSTWSDTGNYELHYLSYQGCDSLINVDISLPDSFNIELNVLFDVDRDSLVGVADTLLPGIAILITNINNGSIINTMTDANGHVLISVPLDDYEVAIDLGLLSTDLVPIVWKDTIYGSSLCGMIPGQILQFLVGDNCQTVTLNESATICSGEFFEINGILQSESGHYPYTVDIDGDGCDTLIDFELIVLPELSDQLSEMICFGDSLEIDGVWQHDPGTYTYAQNEDGIGCDSLIEFELIVTSQIISQMSEAICFGDSLEIDGVWQHDPGTYTYVQNEDGMGCDSLIEFELIVSSETMIQLSEMICFGDSLEIGGVWQHDPGTYNYVQNEDGIGCDSLIEFELIVTSEIFSQISETICFGDSLEIDGVWQNQPGTYTYIAPGVDCDTLVEIQLFNYPITEIILEYDYNCEGLADVFVLAIGEGPFTYNWTPAVSMDSIGFDLVPGIYNVDVTDARGCTIGQEIIVDPEPSIEFTLDTLFQIIEGESVILEISGPINDPGLQVVWTPVNNLSCSSCFAPLAQPAETIVYLTTITDIDGCSIELTTRVEVEPQAQLFIPSGFTPNGDGLNDHFRLASDDDGAIIVRMNVFNRWGSVIFEETNVPVKSHFGWDGSYNDKIIDTQVILYVIDVLYSDGRTEQITGDLTIMK